MEKQDKLLVYEFKEKLDYLNLDKHLNYNVTHSENHKNLETIIQDHCGDYLENLPQSRAIADDYICDKLVTLKEKLFNDLKHDLKEQCYKKFLAGICLSKNVGFDFKKFELIVSDKSIKKTKNRVILKTTIPSYFTHSAIFFEQFYNNVRLELIKNIYDISIPDSGLILDRVYFDPLEDDILYNCVKCEFREIRTNKIKKTYGRFYGDVFEFDTTDFYDNVGDYEYNYIKLLQYKIYTLLKLKQY